MIKRPGPGVFEVGSDRSPVSVHSRPSVLINAIKSQKVSCLCLLDLSAAFDTIDHNILITRLSSWFGIHGSVLSRCSSLTYHLAPFVLNMITTSLSLTLPLVVFPQGSVLGTVLFGMYTLSLSAL